MADFDLKSTAVRILECAKCDEPVSAEVAGQRVSLRCGYCGFEDTRELSTTRSAPEDDSSYRGRASAGGPDGVRVIVDLQRAPEGLRAGKVDALRVQYVAQKHAAAADEDDAQRMAREHRIVWLATNIAARWMQKREYLRARAIYETTLETVRVPAYRALLLARLARLAAIGDAPELAEKWLAAAPEGVRIAEVRSDLRVAEAMIARTRGDHARVLTLIGERNTADAFTGSARFIAIALRVDAHEQLGHDAIARTLWRDGALAGPLLLGAAAGQLGLAPKTRRAASRRAFVTLPVACIGIVALFSAIGHIIADDMAGVPVRIGIGVAALLFMLVMRRV